MLRSFYEWAIADFIFRVIVIDIYRLVRMAEHQEVQERKNCDVARTDTLNSRSLSAFGRSLLL
ncbi:MAG: hypothetical protein HC936_01650 [Leptolyngbyaceae cyanobacterium SU_3_3]|nr:hypothetical protein [Leptolyngbyaceae cyanobacterium SU_3_3]